MAKITAHGDRAIKRYKSGTATLVLTQNGRLLLNMGRAHGSAPYKLVGKGKPANYQPPDGWR